MVKVRLGLVGGVEQPVFKKLLHGKTLQGESLHAKRINPKNHRAATDYTFSAPKSVSIAALIQQDTQVIQAHEQAVETALSVLEERYAQTRISTAQGRQRVTTGNVVIAVFRHQTSREQDPQLHSHCVVINATQLADGTWRSFSNEAIVAHQKLLGEIYQNELAYQLRQLGYEIEPRANGQFELKGYDPHLLNIFLTRTQQIQDYLEQWQQQITADDRTPFDAHQKKQATLHTRRNKQTIPHEILLDAWQQQIQAQPLQSPPLPIPTQEPNSLDWVNHQAALKAGIEHAAEREAVTAVNCSLKYLEQSTENRTDLAAAIDRLHAAVGTKIRSLTGNRQFTSEPRQQRLDGLMKLPVGAVERQSVSDFQPSEQIKAVLGTRERYRQMWKRYSLNVQANNPVSLDYQVAQKAFEDGYTQRDIALTLTAGSPYVVQIDKSQGKQKARTYVNQTARVVCLQGHERKLVREKQKEREMEL